MRCSICHTMSQPGEAIHACPECQQEYHLSCWEDLGGCATYGCQQAAVAEKPALPSLVGAGWGDAKECPKCGKAIPSSLLICQCGARFPHADPMSKEEYRTWLGEARYLKSTRVTLVWLFILSLSGLLAPLLGLIAGIVAHRNRDQLAGSDGTYLAMGYGTAALGGVYSLIIVLLVLGG